MPKNDLPWRLIGLILVVAGALGTVGAIAITNKAAIAAQRDVIEHHNDSQQNQFDDIKNWMIRFDEKLDRILEKR